MFDTKYSSITIFLYHNFEKSFAGFPFSLEPFGWRVGRSRRTSFGMIRSVGAGSGLQQMSQRQRAQHGRKKYRKSVVDCFEFDMSPVVEQASSLMMSSAPS